VPGFLISQIQTANQSEGGVILLAVLVTGVTVAAAIYYHFSRKQAKEDYDVAYSRFAANPMDARLRNKALNEAEAYSRAVGTESSETGIHAASLRQSIETLHRAAKESAEVKKLVAEKAVGPADRLEELQKMMDKGLISEDEFQAKRAQILEEV
jgi:Short C-terminal domain